MFLDLVKRCIFEPKLKNTTAIIYSSFKNFVEQIHNVCFLLNCTYSIKYVSIKYCSFLNT